MMIRVTTLENRFEADLISDALEREGIEFMIRTFEDSAYDGLFVTQKGYANLLVEERDRERTLSLVDDVRQSVEQFEEPDEEPDEE